VDRHIQNKKIIIIIIIIIIIVKCNFHVCVAGENVGLYQRIQSKIVQHVHENVTERQQIIDCYNILLLYWYYCNIHTFIFSIVTVISYHPFYFFLIYCGSLEEIIILYMAMWQYYDTRGHTCSMRFNLTNASSISRYHCLVRVWHFQQNVPPF